MLRERLFCAALAFSCPLPLCAQEVLAREANERREAVPPGSREWFELSCDRFEAELEYDVRAALATARELAEAARYDALGDRRVVACALQELAESTLDGPARAMRCAVDEPAMLSSESPASYRVRVHLARSRTACLRDDSTTELAEAIAALDTSRGLPDSSLRRQALWIAHHATDDVSGAFAHQLILELHEYAKQQPPEHAAARLLVHNFEHERDELPFDRKLERLAALERAASTQGDLRTLESVYWALANERRNSGDLDGGMAELERATQTAAAAGHRRALVNTLYMSTMFALDGGRVDDAARFLDAAEDALAGCGMPNMEGLLLDARFELALARRDSDEVLALADRMEERRHAERDKLREQARLQEQLLSGERDRLDFERKLAEERGRSERTIAWMSRGLWGGALIALIVFAVTLLRARRRLLTANAALREQIERAEQEARARKDVEERMRRLERTESLGLFASGIAHDFNNLMVGVIGNAELLQSGEGSPERARRLKVIVDAGERAARLCAQLRAFVDEENLPLESLDLAEVVRGDGAFLAAAAALRVDVEANGAPLPVMGLRVQLEQALLNLVANARDARATRVRVRVGAVDLSESDFSAAHVRGAARPGRFACIDVEDDGDGMSDDLVERIFDPFFTTRFPGRGLGLAVVFGAMRRHEGLLLVTSVVGRGSRFRLCIPLVDAARDSGAVLVPAQAKVLPRKSAAIGSLQVLAIDDEAHVRDFVSVALQARGHLVAAVDDRCDVAEAFKLLPAGERRVALVDLTMPSQEGREVARRLRAIEPTLTIVLMSGHAAGLLEDTAERVGADGSLAKPFTAGELEHALETALARRALRTKQFAS